MRTKKIALNIMTDILPYLLIGIVGFIKVKFLIDYVGDVGNGYYQFVNQVISYVFIAQMGFKDGVVFKLYKPFANKNYDDVNAIYGGARKILRRIGSIIFGIIVIVTIGLYLFFGFKDGYRDSVLICFFIISTSYLIAYFGKTQAYSAVLDGNQEKYVYSIITNCMKLLCDILIVIATFVFRNLESIALVILSIKIIEEIIIRITVKKKYPWLHEIARKDTSMVKMTKDLAWTQVGYVIFNNIDALLIMWRLGPVSVSIYTSYSYILRFIDEVTGRISNGILLSFGNVFAKDEQESAYKLYWELAILFVVIAFSASFSYLIGIRSFVTVWLASSEYHLSYITAVLFTVTLFLTILSLPLLSIINANGLFKQNKNQLFVYSAINIIGSVILIFNFQMNGVLFSTAVAAFTGIILKANIVSKHVFKDKSTLTLSMPYILSGIGFILLSFLFMKPESLFLKYLSTGFALCVGSLFVFFILFTGIMILLMFLIDKEIMLQLFSRLKILKKKKPNI